MNVDKMRNCGKYLPIVIVILIFVSRFTEVASFNSVVSVGIYKNQGYYGRTLYVGGSGPNNYTRIQDTTNDSSPYYENLFKFIRNLENISSDLKKALLQIINTVINTSKICNEVCSGIDKEKYLANRKLYSHGDKNKESIKKIDIQKIRKVCAIILYTLKNEIPILEKNSMHYKLPTFKYPHLLLLEEEGMIVIITIIT